ncbi:MAG: FAD:protein FMN transferase, partial [Tannerella sp.]|nr:FAD:protein FMN transferase [Tannerella sp.]
YEESGNIFGTTYHIKYKSSQILTPKIDAELQKFDLSLNPFNPNSIVAKVNRNEDVEVDDRFIAVFNKAIEVSEKSDGFFDVTVAPLVNLWGFGFEKSDIISQQIIDSLKTFVGYDKIRLENKKIVKDDLRMKLNFSAIAKGYACDVIAALLEKEGSENYLVNIGREIVTKGKNPSGICWNIGINKPEDENAGMIDEIMEETMMFCDKRGIATSGNYRNYYIRDGKKYAHTINPKTGYPSEENILSATIIADDCMTADAYATAFMAMGVESACQMAENISEIEYYLICSDENNPHKFKIIYSAGMKSMLKK